MEQGAVSILCIFFIVVMTLVLPPGVFGDPRSQVVSLNCSNDKQQNNTFSVINFAATTESMRSPLKEEGYAVGNTGEGPDTVYGLAQCYGDLSSEDCALCYSQGLNVISPCFPSNGGSLFLDGCFLRIENYSFFQEYTGRGDRAVCVNRTKKSWDFQEMARRAVQQAALSAPKNNGYARAEMRVSDTNNGDSVYVLANCWRTLNASSCGACLEKASTSILGCFPWDEARALYTGCFIRYSATNFLNPVPSNGRGSKTELIAVFISCIVCVAGAAMIGAYISRQRRVKKKRRDSFDVQKLAKILRESNLYFEYSTLEKATSGFDEANKVGEGGFGTVYKGVLQDGREIAVKRLFFNNLRRATDFFNEINIISRAVHTNLVKFSGCSCSGNESFLVYEFMPNKSLDHFIFNAYAGRSLNWEKRFAIITGIAEGLVYLHENSNARIVHRDIKANNILLDRRFQAKIADFGLARTFQEDRSHISTTIAGTLGYMAPEYIFHGLLTEKADVYSFGVLILEIVTGRQNNGSRTLEEYSQGLVPDVWLRFLQGTMEELIDPNLKLHNYHIINTKKVVLRAVHVGLLCTQEKPELRPSMSKALQMLAKSDELLPPPSNPPFVDGIPSSPLILRNSHTNAMLSQSTFSPR